MRRFTCPSCGARVFFEDQLCLECGQELHYSPLKDAFELDGMACEDRETPRDCNWISAVPGGACLACAEVSVNPGIADQKVLTNCRAIRRSTRQLLLAGLEPQGPPLAVRFALRDSSNEAVTIGHEDGLISLDAAEGDAVHREQTRTKLREPYRTVLGHVRHELGHWHWQAMIEPSTEAMDRFRALFGDPNRDYQGALEEHYQRDPDPAEWRDAFLSFYASAHPWEDYAENFAHSLHIWDTLETAHEIGLITEVPTDVEHALSLWDRVSSSVNELNRSMGTPDPYPFAPAAEVLPKLEFTLRETRPHPDRP